MGSCNEEVLWCQPFLSNNLIYSLTLPSLAVTSFGPIARTKFSSVMNLILDLPVDYVVQLFGDWLTLHNICDLEVAMCSAQNRLRLGTILESLVLEGKYPVKQKKNDRETIGLVLSSED